MHRCLPLPWLPLLRHLACLRSFVLSCLRLLFPRFSFWFLCCLYPPGQLVHVGRKSCTICLPMGTKAGLSVKGQNLPPTRNPPARFGMLYYFGVMSCRVFNVCHEGEGKKKRFFVLVCFVLWCGHFWFLVLTSRGLM